MVAKLHLSLTASRNNITLTARLAPPTALRYKLFFTSLLKCSADFYRPLPLLLQASNCTCQLQDLLAANYRPGSIKNNRHLVALARFS